MRHLNIKLIKIKIYKKAITATIVLVLLSYIFYTTASSEESSRIRIQYVVVHLDLKGAPPKLTYLEKLLPLLKKYGANGLLIEYEDMFPYDGKLVNIRKTNCYKKNELKHFLTAAVNSGFEVIPLIQTFGHMEHVLKLPKFYHLREIPKYPDSICPSNKRSLALLRNMLRQVISFHDQISPLKYIHIGCDEVFHINSCNECTAKNLQNTSIFLQHITNIKNIISSISPNTSILIWDDMLRKLSPHYKTHFTNIGPVYWDYTPNLEGVRHVSLYNYHKIFSSIWIASAFKGADGRITTIPNMKDRLSNHLSWMQFIQNYIFGGEKNAFGFKGIILTGWSRYSHMEAMCELLPVALPSLILNLILIMKYEKGIENVDTRLNYDAFYEKYLDSDIKEEIKCNNVIYSNIFQSETCHFDGDQLLTAMIEYNSLHNDIDKRFHDDEYGLMSYDFYKDDHLNDIIIAEKNLNWTKNALRQVENVKTKMVHLMAKYYKDDTIDEYVGNKINYWNNKLLALTKVLKTILQVRTWDRY